MSTYLVTARKWRPTRFGDVVGQEHVSQTLRNALRSDRVHHAYIFNGPRGVGKTTTARILAKALNCTNRADDGEPCNSCASCLDISAGKSIDVVEIDGASNNSVDDVRALRENAKYPPQQGSHKMYIIDEVHMLSTSAFNALLKTLEEPPRHLVFVFATTEPHKIPATILSRCQRFDFRRMQIQEIVGHLGEIATAEGFTIDDASLAVIAQKGDGSMRDSQSIFDQVIAFCGTTVRYEDVIQALNLVDRSFFFRIAEVVRAGDVTQIFEISRDIFLRGYDLHECLGGLAEHYRNILTVVATGDTHLIEAGAHWEERYRQAAAQYTQTDCLNLLSMLSQAEMQLKHSAQPRLKFEFALLQMATVDTSVNVAELVAQIREIKKKGIAGSPTLPADTTPKEKSKAPAPGGVTEPQPVQPAPHAAPPGVSLATAWQQIQADGNVPARLRQLMDSKQVRAEAGETTLTFVSNTEMLQKLITAFKPALEDLLRTAGLVGASVEFAIEAAKTAFGKSADAVTSHPFIEAARKKTEPAEGTMKAPSATSVLPEPEPEPQQEHELDAFIIKTFRCISVPVKN